MMLDQIRRHDPRPTPEETKRMASDSSGFRRGIGTVFVALLAGLALTAHAYFEPLEPQEPPVEPVQTCQVVIEYDARYPQQAQVIARRARYPQQAYAIARKAANPCTLRADQVAIGTVVLRLLSTDSLVP